MNKVIKHRCWLESKFKIY